MDVVKFILGVMASIVMFGWFFEAVHSVVYCYSRTPSGGRKCR